MSFRLIVFFSIFCFSLNFLALDLDADRAEEAKIEADEMEHNTATNVATGTGNVVITYGITRMKADKISVNQNTNDFSISGNVRIIRPDGEWKMQTARGNLDTGEVKFGPFRANNGVEFSRGESGKQNREGKITVNNAWISTCEYEKPHYQLQAAKITYYKSGYYLAKHVTLKFFRVPVFYFPILFGMDRDNIRSGYIVQPGYSGKRGAYLRLGRLWKYAEGRGETRVYGEVMSKRGLGVGMDSTYHNEKRDVKLQAYQLNDKDTPETSHDWNRRFKARDDRHRIHGYYREQITEGLSLRMNLDKLSDIDMLEDWFKRDYRSNPQPKSFADLSYNHRYFDAQLYVRPRINDFNTVVETMPEMRVNIPALKIGGSPFVYDSENSMGYYQVKWREFDLLRDHYLPGTYPWSREENADYAAWRMDTLHTISMPLDLGGVVNFIPRASFRGTSYSRSSRKHVTEQDHINNLTADSPDLIDSLAPVTHYDNLGGSMVRFAGELGFEINSRFISSWLDYDSDFLNLHQLRHVIQPYLNYTFAPEPTEDREQIYFFDEVDRLTRQNFLRLGLDQRFQTRRGGEVVNWLEWQSYFDIHFADYEGYDDPWGIFGNRIDVPLNEYFSTYGVLAYEVSDGEVQRAGAGFTLGRDWKTTEHKEPNLTVGYNYYNDLLPRAAYSMGSNLLDLTGQGGFLKSNFGQAEEISARLNFPINEKTWAECYLAYDLKDSKVSRNFYHLTRVLHCWTVTAGVGWDNDVFEAMVIFRLTALPNIKIDFDFY